VITRNIGVLYQKLIDNQTQYIMPYKSDKPQGFTYDGYYSWKTSCLLHALNAYRNGISVSSDLEEHFYNLIKEQDILYNLSSSINSNILLPDGINENFIPRPHQLVAIEFGKLTNGKFIIADQQRTGKSYSALLYALTQEWDKCLIICPAKVVLVWKAMISTISNKPINIIETNGKIVNGFNIISYDSLHTIGDKGANITIADEGHFFVQKGARRTNAVFEVDSEQKIVLSGTPILNSVYEMTTILDWINPDFSKEIREFLSTYDSISSYELARGLGKELRKKCLLLRETNQVGDTVEPYINYIDIDVKVNDIKNLREVGVALTNYAVEYLNSFNHKIVIMVYFKEVGNVLKARLGEKSILVNGDNSKKQVTEAIEVFKNTDVQFLIGSTVLAEGIDLSFCNHILLLEESYSMRTDQMRSRCDGIYKSVETTIDILRAKKTQDDRLYAILKNKYELQDGFRDS